MSLDEPRTDPPWVRDAAKAVWHELHSYLTTLLAVARAPRRFADAWRSGERVALNPLAFALNALAVLGPWRVMWARLYDPKAPTTPLWFEAVKPVFPLVLNVVATAIVHAILRLMGSRRPLRSSLAMALYVTGGPVAVVNFIVAPVVLLGFIHRTDHIFLTAGTVANLTLLVIFLVYLVAAEAALHRKARWQVAIVILLTWTLWGTFSAWMGTHHPEVIRALLGG